MATRPALKSVKKGSGAEAWRSDDLVNTLTRMGDATRDKRLQTYFEADKISQQQLEEWYRGSDLAATIVDLVPEEMFRQGFGLFFGDEEDRQAVSADMMSLLDERQFLDKLQEGFSYARAYGGCGILLGADDGQELDQPLNEEAIKTFGWLTLLTPQELRPVKWFTDVRSAQFSEVEMYELRPARQANEVQPSGLPVSHVLVHASRILRLDGVRVSRNQKRSGDSLGWGDSVLVRCYGIVRDYTAGWQGAASMLQTFAQPYMKLARLAEILEGEDSHRALMMRALGVQLSRNVANMVLMDKEEEMGVISTSLAGYPEIMQQFAIRLSAACRIPVTLLMGQAPSGLNATGDSDVRNFYARIGSLQNKQLKPALNRILHLLFLSDDGPTDGTEPETWEVRFNSLWQLTELQQAEQMAKVASADDVYLRNGVTMPEEIAVSRFGTGEFNTTTTIDVEARERPDPTAAPAPAPADPTQPPKVNDPNAVNPQSALNGAQVQAATDVITRVAMGQLPRETGVAMLTAFFPLTKEQAELVMGTVGRGFEPAVVEPAPAPAAPGT